jgi:hypothetical protein
MGERYGNGPPAGTTTAPEHASLAGGDEAANTHKLLRLRKIATTQALRYFKYIGDMELRVHDAGIGPNFPEKKTEIRSNYW